jgi:hypothetical protein
MADAYSWPGIAEKAAIRPGWVGGTRNWSPLATALCRATRGRSKPLGLIARPGAVARPEWRRGR